jgi:hypothetical protein
MVIDMDESRLRTIAQLSEFLTGTLQVQFGACSTDSDEVYAHIARVLARFDYGQRTKAERGVIREYLIRTSGYSRAQLTRLIGRWHANRAAALALTKRYRAPSAPFARKYLASDVNLLVEMDSAHDDICGPAVAHLLRRAYLVYGDERYARLSQLSVSHLYKLRKSAGYRAQRIHISKTSARANSIGVRQAPRPQGRAGYVRIDSVHQGDFDGIKGVYHITCVDEISQWQVQSCVQGISEAFLLPVLALVMEQFPFEINGFHSDNGSEYVNHQVARLLDKLRIEQTKSRSRHSNDNALAESKNASVVRKHFGYEHIPAQYARPINAFLQTTFNPWLNLHRPCMYASTKQNAKGKLVKLYKPQDVKTPLEQLTKLHAEGLVTLKPGVSLQALQAAASATSDLAAASQMRQAKAALFAQIHARQKQARRA